LVRADIKVSELLVTYRVPKPKTPKSFKLVLDFIDLSKPNIRVRYFWKSERDDCSRADWVPASTVKMFAAFAALSRLSDYGFRYNSNLKFLDRSESVSVEDLIVKAIVYSDNMSYNRLVQFSGHFNIHDTYLRNYPNTELNKPYMRAQWEIFTRGNRTFSSPEIILADTVKIAPSRARGSVLCGNLQACTTLCELNDLLFDLMYRGSSQLSKDNLDFLRTVLSFRKPSGYGFSDSIVKASKGLRFLVSGKHGFNGSTYSESAYLYEPNHRKVVIVSAEGYPGDRSILNSVGDALGKLFIYNFFK